MKKTKCLEKIKKKIENQIKKLKTELRERELYLKNIKRELKKKM